ncbi:hypothetical protein BS17DRAFT_765135 [Gyrodon lividus]|nr:hypothetical protein BS17DRAFT_765135 [Gyrodon lividus]
MDPATASLQSGVSDEHYCLVLGQSSSPAVASWTPHRGARCANAGNRTDDALSLKCQRLKLGCGDQQSVFGKWFGRQDLEEGPEDSRPPHRKQIWMTCTDPTIHKDIQRRRLTPGSPTKKETYGWENPRYSNQWEVGSPLRLRNDETGKTAVAQAKRKGPVSEPIGNENVGHGNSSVHHSMHLSSPPNQLQSLDASKHGQTEDETFVPLLS